MPKKVLLPTRPMMRRSTTYGGGGGYSPITDWFKRRRTERVGTLTAPATQPLAAATLNADKM